MTQHTFTFPKSLGGGTVTMGELSLSAQLDGAKINGDDILTMLPLEYAKRCIVRDGTDETEFEKWFNGLSGRHRELIVRAYLRINSPAEGDVRAAIASINKADIEGQEYHQATINGKLYRFGTVTVSALAGLAKRAKENIIVLNIESCIASLAAVDGSSIADKRTYFAGLNPKERQIVIRVFTAINSTTEEEEESFFASEKSISGGG